jgi:biopolymer transport protein ExbD
VLLVLVIIFMLAMSVEGRLDLQLPDPGSRGRTADAIVLSIDPGPAYALNGQQVSATDLVGTLRRTYAGRLDRILFVDGSPVVRYQEVIAAFDAARSAGIRVTGVRSRPR